MMPVSRLSHLLSQTFVQNTTRGQQQSTAGIFNQFQSRPDEASDEAQPCERPSEQRSFLHDERSSKELDIRNAKCVPRQQGAETILMFMLRKAVKAHFARIHAFVISWDTMIRESKTCGRESKTTEIPSNICSRKFF